MQAREVLHRARRQGHVVRRLERHTVVDRLVVRRGGSTTARTARPVATTRRPEVGPDPVAVAVGRDLRGRPQGDRPGGGAVGGTRVARRPAACGAGRSASASAAAARGRGRRGAGSDGARAVLPRREVEGCVAEPMTRRSGAVVAFAAQDAREARPRARLGSIHGRTRSIEPARGARGRRRAREASHGLALATRAQKDAALHAMADALVAGAAEVLAANAEDVARAEAGGTPANIVDRLRLDRRAARRHGRRGCATSPACPTRSARWCGAARWPTGWSCARCGCRSAWSG